MGVLRALASWKAALCRKPGLSREEFYEEGKRRFTEDTGRGTTERTF